MIYWIKCSTDYIYYLRKRRKGTWQIPRQILRSYIQTSPFNIISLADLPYLRGYTLFYMKFIQFI